MNTKTTFIPLFFMLSSILYCQRDTTIYFPSKGEYEIRSWSNIAGKDTFLTTIFIPTTKINPSVKSSISRDVLNNTLNYHYKISNSSKSQQAIEFFILEISKNIFYTNVTTNGWFWGREGRLNGCSWADTIFLAPGTEKDGFIIKSDNLPGIGNAYFQEQLPFYTYSEEESSYYLEKTLDSLSDFPLNFVQRKTLVPVNLALNIATNYFLDTLKSYIRQAYSLKWIADKKEDDKEKDNKEKEKDSGIVKELMKYLDKAREQLSKNKIKEAKKQLKEFVEKVEENYHENDKDEEKEKLEHGYLTSEAYALLKYNAEYLIEQIK